MQSMPMGPDGERWCRLLLVALLVLPGAAVIGMYVDDGGMAVADLAESDESRLRIAAGVLCDCAWILPAPSSARHAGWLDARDPVIADWTCLTPPDRAPPRA
jgi:hypothetical protein